MLAPPLFPSPERAFLSSLACSWEHIAVPWRVRRRRNQANWICLETPIMSQCHPRGIYLDLFKPPLKSNLWGINQMCFLPTTLFPFPSAWHSEKAIRKDSRACRIKTCMTGLKGGRIQWYVSPGPFFLFFGIVWCSCLWFSSSFWKGEGTKTDSGITTGQGWNVPCVLLPELDKNPVVN